MRGRAWVAVFCLLALAVEPHLALTARPTAPSAATWFTGVTVEPDASTTDEEPAPQEKRVLSVGEIHANIKKMKEEIEGTDTSGLGGFGPEQSAAPQGGTGQPEDQAAPQQAEPAGDQPAPQAEDLAAKVLPPLMATQSEDGDDDEKAGVHHAVSDHSGQPLHLGDWYRNRGTGRDISSQEWMALADQDRADYYLVSVLPDDNAARNTEDSSGETTKLARELSAMRAELAALRVETPSTPKTTEVPQSPASKEESGATKESLDTLTAALDSHARDVSLAAMQAAEDHNKLVMAVDELSLALRAYNDPDADAGWMRAKKSTEPAQSVTPQWHLAQSSDREDIDNGHFENGMKENPGMLIAGFVMSALGLGFFVALCTTKVSKKIHQIQSRRGNYNILPGAFVFSVLIGFVGLDLLFHSGSAGRVAAIVVFIVYFSVAVTIFMNKNVALSSYKKP